MRNIVKIMLLSCIACAASDKFELGGFVKTDNRLRLNDPYKFGLNENTLNFNIKSKNSEKVAFSGELELVGQGFQNIININDLQEINKVSKLWIELRGA